jgi:hypothetical protein
VPTSSGPALVTLDAHTRTGVVTLGFAEETPFAVALRLVATSTFGSISGASFPSLLLPLRSVQVLTLFSSCSTLVMLPPTFSGTFLATSFGGRFTPSHFSSSPIEGRTPKVRLEINEGGATKSWDGVVGEANVELTAKTGAVKLGLGGD